MTSKTSKPFWADLSAKTATWGGVAALAVTALEVVEPLVEAEATTAVSWKHGLAVIGAAVIRAIIGLVQGKVGDPDKASFKAAAADNPDVPDDDEGGG